MTIWFGAVRRPELPAAPAANRQRPGRRYDDEDDDRLPWESDGEPERQRGAWRRSGRLATLCGSCYHSRRRPSACRAARPARPRRSGTRRSPGGGLNAALGVERRRRHRAAATAPRAPARLCRSSNPVTPARSAASSSPGANTVGPSVTSTVLLHQAAAGGSARRRTAMDLQGQQPGHPRLPAREHEARPEPGRLPGRRRVPGHLHRARPCRPTTNRASDTRSDVDEPPAGDRREPLRAELPVRRPPTSTEYPPDPPRDLRRGGRHQRLLGRELRPGQRRPGRRARRRRGRRRNTTVSPRSASGARPVGDRSTAAAVSPRHWAATNVRAATACAAEPDARPSGWPARSPARNWSAGQDRDRDGGQQVVLPEHLGRRSLPAGPGGGRRPGTGGRRRRPGGRASAGTGSRPGTRRRKSAFWRAAGGSRTSTSTTTASAFHGTGGSYRTSPAFSYRVWTACPVGRGRPRWRRSFMAQSSQRLIQCHIEVLPGGRGRDGGADETREDRRDPRTGTAGTGRRTPPAPGRGCRNMILRLRDARGNGGPDVVPGLFAIELAANVI